MRMNLGCGPVQPEGWWNLDPDEAWLATVAAPGVGEWDEIPHGFDLVVANHVLQMIDWDELVTWLVAVRLKLRAGGVLRLLVPDAAAAFDAWARGDRDWYPIDDRHERSVDGKLCMYLTQAGATRSVFTASWLVELCERAGYARVVVLEHGTLTPPEWGACELDSRLDESIILEATA